MAIIINDILFVKMDDLTCLQAACDGERIIDDQGMKYIRFGWFPDRLAKRDDFKRNPISLEPYKKLENEIRQALMRHEIHN